MENTNPSVENQNISEQEQEEQVQTASAEALEIERLKAEVQSEKDKALRSFAELENFRKRSQQEVDSFKKYAAEKVVVEFLPILDSFTLACDHAQKESGQKSSVIDGFVLIQRQLVTALERLNVTPIEALDQPFNPNFHQAISQQKVEGKASGTVIQEVQKGYKLHDRVLRPTLVIVAE